MKKAAILSVFIVVSAAIAADQTCMLKIDGMTCNGCASKVKASLEKVQGIKQVDVSLAGGSAVVVYDDKVTGHEAMVKAVTDLGYKAALQDESGKPVTKKVVTAEPQVEKQSVDRSAAVGETKEAIAEINAEQAEQMVHKCAGIRECKELIEFHEAMHPIAVAIGFEGDEGKDYDFIRKQYPELKLKMSNLEKMKIDDRVISDRKQFVQKRKELKKAVDAFGMAIKKNDHALMDKTFEVVHQGFIDLAMLSR